MFASLNFLFLNICIWISSLHGKSMAFNGRIQFGIRCNVLKDLARSFDIHRCQAQQESHQRLSTIHGRWNIAGYWHCYHVDMAIRWSILSRYETNRTNCMLKHFHCNIFCFANQMLLSLTNIVLFFISTIHRWKMCWLCKRTNIVNQIK